MSASALSKSAAKEFFDLQCYPEQQSLYSANERTFLHWLNISITVGSIAAAMLGVSGHVHKNWGIEYQEQAIVARVLALLVMFTSIIVAIYAACLYMWRSVALKERLAHGYSSILLPITITIVMTLVLLSVFAGALRSYQHLNNPASPADAPAPTSFEMPSTMTQDGLFYERSLIQSIE